MSSKSVKMYSNAIFHTKGLRFLFWDFLNFILGFLENDVSL